MPLYDLGPRTRRIYQSLTDRIRSGELPPGSQLPPHKKLATDFGVAPMTIRQVLARLEDEGLVIRQVGRGTFVCAVDGSRVVILASPSVAETLSVQIGQHLVRGVSSVATVEAALAVLRAEPRVALLLAEVRPGLVDLDVIRLIRRRWPRLTIAALVESAVDLTALYDAPDFPSVILPIPPQGDRVAEVLRLAVPSPTDDSPEVQALAGLEMLRFQSLLLDSVDQAIVATTTAGEILYWNRGAERLYGWQASEVQGRNIGEIIVSQEQYAAGVEIMDRLRLGKRWSGEFLVRHRDGHDIPVLVTDSPIRDHAGNLLGIIGVAVDITERKQAEHDRHEVARLETALRSLQLGNKHSPGS
jgi:PAS domain S-box-containing protein